MTGDMNDTEELLHGYRPAGPPPDLRARIMREAGRPARAGFRDWLPALATAALIILLSLLASTIRGRAYDRVAEPDVPQNVEGLIQ